MIFQTFRDKGVSVVLKKMYRKRHAISELVVYNTSRKIHEACTRDFLSGKKIWRKWSFLPIFYRASLLFLAAEERGISGIAIFIVGALGAHVYENRPCTYSDLEKFHTKSWTALTLLRWTRFGSNRAAAAGQPFSCVTRAGVYRVIMHRGEMLRRDTALSVNSASIRYDNCIYIAFEDDTAYRLTFQNVREKCENF